MCGIAAIFAYNPPAPDVEQGELLNIREHMRTRGPDGEGMWISKDKRFGMAHRRLAIIDPDPRSAQPMFSADGRYAITYNGEIYNYRALREELESRGAAFRTESDTEVLLALFAAHGEAMLGKLRGMFALAIWDTERRRLFLARDPLGIKPLYYADDGWTLRLASQVKALVAGGKVASDLEPAGIVGFYLFGSVPEPYTQYQQIRQLPAGHYLWTDELGAGAPRAYFSVAGAYATPSNMGHADIRSALLDSVRNHLVADVPVGAFLSSGIDSGALVGLMRDAGQDDIQTITLAFEEFRGRHEDEAPLAEKIARQYGTRHHTRWISREEFEQDLPLILKAMDQPSIDGINTWFVSKAAAEQGLKVAVSGLGGDELFGGYPSFRDLPRWVSWLRIPGRLPLLGKVLRMAAAPVTAGLSQPKLAGMIEYGGRWPGAYLLKRGLFMPWELPSILGPDLAREGLRRLQPLRLIEAAMEGRIRGPRVRVACLESSLYMRNQLLRDADWAGMAHSLEIRVPLVDFTLMRQAAAMGFPSPSLDKQALALAPSRPLPDEVRRRSKSGFTTPIDRWMRHRSQADAGGSRTGQHWSRDWCRAISGIETAAEHA